MNDTLLQTLARLAPDTNFLQVPTHSDEDQLCAQYHGAKHTTILHPEANFLDAQEQYDLVLLQNLHVTPTPLQYAQHLFHVAKQAIVQIPITPNHVTNHQGSFHIHSLVPIHTLQDLPARIAREHWKEKKDYHTWYSLFTQDALTRIMSLVGFVIAETHPDFIVVHKPEP